MTNASPALETLHTYLNDHLAGSQAALQLLDDLVENAKVPGDAAFFAELRSEVTADREVLEAVIAATGGRPSQLRQLGGWIVEKASQLKLMLDDPTRGTLERLEALEFLVLGIHGKRALWRALSAMGLPALERFDFRQLENRATAQHDRVEARRIDAARRAIGPDA